MKNGNSNVLMGFYLNVKDDEIGNMRGKPIGELEKMCNMGVLEDIANKAFQRKSSVRTRSETIKLHERVRLGLDEPDGGACRSRVFNEVLSRGVLPSGQVVYEVSYIVGTTKIEKRWIEAAKVPAHAVDAYKRRQSAFKYSVEEKELMKECLGSLKERLAVEACSSIGVLAFILDCGTIISLSQLHGAESLTQVYMKALDLYRDNPDLPVLGYDDGCHLRRFAELRQNLTQETKAFWEQHGRFIVVDRYHFRNHKKSHKYCQDHCNPNQVQSIDGANSQICEQSFRWLSRFKYSMNHMTPARFAFFLLIMAARRNSILAKKRSK
uniref:Uncharacterized protein n=2 Tax=Octactis speculum TaxID=3111310 RepID=A0A6U3RUP3_9STRA|mmetsp:Transcript_27373/g.37540  ORF Transcript_27373/g.37540 Transcript_27373/m.37540 type:complete len:324 (+) Transcript_27373:1411-2382(+)